MVGTPPEAPKHGDPKTADASALTDAQHEERAKALARAAAAEQEAAAAAQRVRDAHAKAARERTIAAEGDPDAQREDTVSVNTDDHDLHHAILAHEAAALVNLHAQAIGVQNIRSLVHVVLNLTAGNYTHWRDQILLVIGKYSLESHVLADLPAPGFPNWTRMDCVVKSWITWTISTDLAETVIDRTATARVVWCALEDHLLGNKETRALHLDV